MDEELTVKTTKVCSKCSLELSIDMFYNSKTRADGKRSQCKECISKQKKEYYLKNKATILSKSSEYYMNNSDAVKQTKVEYRANNLDKIIAYKNKYFNENHQKLIDYQRAYAKNNPELLSANHKKYMKSDKGKAASRKANHRRRGFAPSTPINKYFKGAEEHHLHINNSTDTVFIPRELHICMGHKSTTGNGILGMAIISSLFLTSQHTLEA